MAGGILDGIMDSPYDVDEGCLLNKEDLEDFYETFGKYPAMRLDVQGGMDILKDWLDSHDYTEIVTMLNVDDCMWLGLPRVINIIRAQSNWCVKQKSIADNIENILDFLEKYNNWCVIKDTKGSYDDNIFLVPKSMINELSDCYEVVV